MVTYCKITLNFDKTKKEVLNSISTLILNDKDDYYGIFPFCLLDRRYYSYLKKFWVTPYRGVTQHSNFNLNKTIQYLGKAPTYRTIVIDGELLEKMGRSRVILNYKMSSFEATGFLLFLTLFFTVYLVTKEPVWLVGIAILPLNELWIIWRNTRIIVNRIRQSKPDNIK